MLQLQFNNPHPHPPKKKEDYWFLTWNVEVYWNTLNFTCLLIRPVEKEEACLSICIETQLLNIFGDAQT